MKKNKIRCGVILAAVPVIYHVVIFAAPFARNSVFFLSWIFTLAAIAAEVYAVYTAFHRGKDTRSRFYGFPIARIGVIYLIVQMVLGLVFMILGSFFTVPLWIPLILYVILCGMALIGLVAVDTMREEVQRQDAKLKTDVACMRTLQSRALSIVQLAGDDKVRAALEKFSEELRFSDPVSSEALKDIEADLTACVDELQQAVADGDSRAALMLAQKAGSVLAERNRLCRRNK